MDLNRIQARIRPRSAWEALDLGLVFARQWFRELWVSWLMLAIPMFIVAHILLYDQLWAAAMIVWWFKPLYEQPLLYILSRDLFGEHVDTRFVRQNLSSIIRPHLLANLTWRRLSLHRAFNNPVAMLEGLGGDARKARLKLLHRQQHLSQWLTIIGVHIEAIFNLGLLALIAMLIPESTDWLEFSDFFADTSEKYQLAGWINNLGYLLAMSIMAPFYVGAGFSLYLYTRVRLEAWEIEIAFRQIRNRLAGERARTGALLIPVLLLSAALLAPPELRAEPLTAAAIEHDNGSARQLIETILEDEAFGRMETETNWRLKEQDSEQEPGGLGEWLARFLEWLLGDIQLDSEGEPLNLAAVLEALLWILVAVAIILLIRKLGPSLAGINWRKATTNPGDSPELTPSLLAEQLQLDELPEDIISEVESLVNQGNFRPALSLLYRGALRYLIETRSLEIPVSATEQDCAALVTVSRPGSEAQYFERLTTAWLVLAYAHQTPDKRDIDALSQQWREFYEAGS